uniref:FUZ/MON1/HPS1 first Longin domain-containing protein n=1 Tax=Ciona savignyi TaxID=51511 RepID=H2ZBY7_CIOSA
MKGFLIAEDTHIVYYWCDAAFTAHLTSLGGETIEYECNFESYVLMYFSPVILSHHMLKSKLNESCSSIISHDTTIVFQDYREYVYIGIEKDCIGGKEKLRRELSFLRNTIGFLLGPCGHNELKTPEVDFKQRAWQGVTTILQQYILLCNTENSFILEA